MNTWRIDLTLDPPKIRPQQREYLIACELANAGVPINVFNWQLSHGKLTVMEERDGTRLYTWIGEDWRQ